VGARIPRRRALKVIAGTRSRVHRFRAEEGGSNMYIGIGTLILIIVLIALLT
jgi:hypothetical protein